MKVAILILLVALVFANNCGGNCPSGRCQGCQCGATKNIQDIATWCAKYNWNQKCCKCIIAHGSGGNANYMEFNSGFTTLGMWAISMGYWGSCNGGKPPCNI